MIRSREFRLAAVVFLCIFLLLACGKQGSTPSKSVSKLTIAVVPKGTTHEFWKSVHAGAALAASELGVEVIWIGPYREDDRSQQVTLIETLINRRVDGIVLAPLDERALVKPVQEAVKEKIPVVIIDSGLQGSDYISYIATDNYKSGMIAARHLGQLLKGRGKVILVRYQVGSASTSQREAGFLETIKSEFKDINILSEDQYAGATTDTAYQLAENLISRYTYFDGIFTPNESTTFGTLRALQDSGLAGKVKFIGFDCSAKLLKAMREGHILGLIVQNPMKMGYLGVKTVVAHIRGQPYEKIVDTGVILATPENMDHPEIKLLLEPDFSKYIEK